MAFRNESFEAITCCWLLTCLAIAGWTGLEPLPFTITQSPWQPWQKRSKMEIERKRIKDEQVDIDIAVKMNKLKLIDNYFDIYHSFYSQLAHVLMLMLNWIIGWESIETLYLEHAATRQANYYYSCNTLNDLFDVSLLVKIIINLISPLCGLVDCYR